MKQLILGGARSGKSSLAQQRALASEKDVIFIATATAGDAEMSARIARHQAERPAHWTLVEEPITLADALTRHDSSQHCLLVDCLTLWLSNLIDDQELYLQQRKALFEVFPKLTGKLILVSNEVGQGITPMGEISRRFVDEAGRLHQELATQCDEVTFVTAGLPLTLKHSHSILEKTL